VLPVRGWKWQWWQMVAWAADGRTLFAEVESGYFYSLLAIDANGSAHVLQELPPGSVRITSIAASPDGRFLAFSERAGFCNVALLENF
jgi:hypothetical protein